MKNDLRLSVMVIFISDSKECSWVQITLMLNKLLHIYAYNQKKKNNFMHQLL